MNDYFDVIIVGAGISGISAAYHMQKQFPSKSYTVLEARSALGGTWDLFRYPGVRSDSDMYTLGFSFYPWRGEDAIADGADIRAYLEETAVHFGIDKAIRFNQTVRTANWDKKTARWTLTIETAAGIETVQCKFIIMGTGYYSYSAPYQPAFPNQAAYEGQIIHPQHWPEDLDATGKSIIVIGSGATAASLVPALAKTAEHVVMLQRTPSYMVARPRQSRLGKWLPRLLPQALSAPLLRALHLRMSRWFYRWCQRNPKAAARWIAKGARAHLGQDYEVNPHFSPAYRPWEQRMCLLPEGDLYKSIASGKVNMVTDTIQCFTEMGVLCESGMELAADIIITATGLNMELLSGIDLTVDGQPIKLRKTISYKGFMFSGVPNLVHCFGYANASWTLKAELICGYAMRLLKHMDKQGFDYCVPRSTGILPLGTPVLNLNAGYVLRAAIRMPKQSEYDPWRVHNDYFTDKKLLKRGRLKDSAMAFERAG